MELIENPNKWSCGLASLAMLLGRPISQLITELGHDGSEIISPESPEPMNRRSFDFTELQHLCWNRGRALAPFDCDPTILVPSGKDFHIYDPDSLDQRMFDLIARRPGLLEGCYCLDRPHVTAWDGTHVYDPLGPRKYSFDDSNSDKLSVRTFWLLV